MYPGARERGDEPVVYATESVVACVCYDHRPVSSSLLGPVDSSFRALSGRLKFTVRRHNFNKDSLSWRRQGADEVCVSSEIAENRWFNATGRYLRLIDLCITQL